MIYPAVTTDGWDAAMTRLAERLERVGALERARVQAGLLGTVAADGPSDARTLVRIGRAHEYGIGVPRRPWLSTSLERYRNAWVQRLSRALEAQLAGDRNGVMTALRATGIDMIGDIQQTILDGPWTPNSAVTISRKMRTNRAPKPGERAVAAQRELIDSGQMRQSIRAQVWLAPGSVEVLS